MSKSGGGVVLKEEDQSRLNYIISSFARTEANILKFSELMMLLLDRCVFSNKFTLGEFHRIFQSSQKVPNSKPLDKDSLQGERIVGRDQLIFIFNEIGKKLFKTDPNHQSRFYRLFLSEHEVVENEQINRSRVMVFDQTNKKLLFEECIRKIVSYETELYNVFVAYMIQNYWSLKRSKRLLLSPRQIFLQNKKWSFTSFIFFLKESETTPHLLNIDQIQEFMRMIIPNTNSKQQQFYSRHVLSDCYQKENQNIQETTHLGDPGIVFFQFQLIIARIAWDSFPREMEKKNIEDVIERYFRYLSLRKNQDFQSVDLPNFNRKMILKMKQFYIVLKQQKKPDITSNNIVELYTPSEIMAKKIEQTIINAPDLNFDFKEAMKNLQKQLPKLPPIPIVTPENPPPFKKDQVITIGMQPPPEPVDKNQKGGGKTQKKDTGKKDEPPPRQFKWQNMPQMKMSAEQFLQNVETKLNFEVKPLTDISRGTIKKEAYPVIIGEVLFPPQLPKSVAPFVKSAANALCERNFVLALENYAKALLEWKKTNLEIQPSTELFFQYSKGNVYLTAGKLQYALQSFYLSRKFSDTSRLPFSNPDRSLPYFGLGQVLYQMEQFQLSTRCFLKARQIREGVLGLEHVQTATTFNNLGCCYYMLERSHEALGYIQIAEVVLDTELGAHHERTMTCRSNMLKISHGTYQNKPQYRKLWQVFEEDKFQKKKKKKEKQGKKK